MSVGEILAFAVVFACAILWFGGIFAAQPEIDNISAYDAVYNELNETKYRAVCNISLDWYIYESDRVDYANDYIHGYEARMNDDEYNETMKIKNETLNILGLPVV